MHSTINNQGLFDALEAELKECRKERDRLEKALIEKCMEADTMRQLHANAEVLIERLSKQIYDTDPRHSKR